MTTPRDGLLEVALTWTPITAAGAAEPLGFSVTDPKGKSWSPTEAGITRQVHLPASRRDVFKINLWSMPGEEFELHTLLR